MAGYQDMMNYAVEQLRAEGVPEANLRAAAAHLVGQGYMESGLNPSAVHDDGTGYGIYGARLDRRDAMLKWMQANGYQADNPEGQMRYMAHEAMTAPAYAQTRGILSNASPDKFNQDSRAITANFERPAVINDRSSAVQSAFNAWGGQQPPMGGVLSAPSDSPQTPTAAAVAGNISAPSNSAPAPSPQPFSLAGLLSGQQQPIGDTGATVSSHGLKIPGLAAPAAEPPMGGQQTAQLSAPEQSPLSMALPTRRQAQISLQPLSTQLQQIGLRGLVV